MIGAFAILHCFVYLGTSLHVDCQVMPWGTFRSAEDCQANLERRLANLPNGNATGFEEQYVCAERSVRPR